MNGAELTIMFCVAMVCITVITCCYFETKYRDKK
jgi:hypothetical protein